VVSAFRVSVYDKDRVFQGQVGNPSSLEVTPRHGGLIGTGRMTVPLAHKQLPKLMADGARLRIHFKGELVLSGPIVADELSTDGKSGSYTVSVEDDKRILWDIAGWPVPGSPIGAQSGAEYRTYTGNAESIIKTAVTENGVNRLGIPGLMVAPNLNRGAVVPGGVALRMHPLADRMFPALEDAGIGVTVQQQGTALVLDVYEPVTHPRTLSTAGRTLKQVKMTRTRPKASRAILGGPGDGTQRIFGQVTDEARESAYGMRAEVFGDVRDAKDDPDTGATATGIMTARGHELLTENGPKNGVALTLSGSGIFKYGPGGFHVGDRIPVRITDEITVVEVIRECTLKWVSRDYASVEPAIGELTDRPERVTAQRLAAVARAQRDQERR
jgi:hypothetical protein